MKGFGGRGIWRLVECGWCVLGRRRGWFLGFWIVVYGD